MSTPSSPNLFSDDHFLARNASNPMDLSSSLIILLLLLASLPLAYLEILASSSLFWVLSSSRAPGVSSLDLGEDEDEGMRG